MSHRNCITVIVGVTSVTQMSILIIMGVQGVAVDVTKRLAPTEAVSGGCIWLGWGAAVYECPHIGTYVTAYRR